MNGLDDALLGIVQRSAAHENPEDYYSGGLLYCGNCKTQKQCVVELFGEKITVGCTCQCEQARLMEEKERQKKEERMLNIRSMRAQCIQDFAVREYRFSKAEETENISRCKIYAQRWPEMLEHNNGLLFWGCVGTGKTFAAACIANAIIDTGTPALVTSFPKILNSGWEKSEIVRQMKEYPLLILDDLGVERESDYSLEIVQFVVDERYKSQLPLIVTTNLRLDDLEHPKNMRFQRIYDRILEMCVPVYFGGKSRRKEKADDKMRFAREVFGWFRSQSHTRLQRKESAISAAGTVSTPTGAGSIGGSVERTLKSCMN